MVDRTQLAVADKCGHHSWSVILPLLRYKSRITRTAFYMGAFKQFSVVRSFRDHFWNFKFNFSFVHFFNNLRTFYNILCCFNLFKMNSFGLFENYWSLRSDFKICNEMFDFSSNESIIIGQHFNKIALSGVSSVLLVTELMNRTSKRCYFRPWLPIFRI